MTFGTGGIVTGPVGQAFSLAIQPADQKIVVAGDGYNRKGDQGFALARYNTDGSLDTSFGSGGQVLTMPGSGYPTFNSVLVQPDGKILAGGSDSYFQLKGKSYDFVFSLARYNTNGSLDTSFGSGGEVTTLFPSISVTGGIGTVLLRSDGEILAVGGGNGAGLVLALYQPNGALDTSFGSSGTVAESSLSTTTSTANTDGTVTTVQQSFVINNMGSSCATLESDNSVLFAGNVTTETKVTDSTGAVLSDTTQHELGLVHFLADGTWDRSFGTGGIAAIPIAQAASYGSNVTVQSNGAIVEVGEATVSNGDGDMVAARYNPNGTPDTTFGGGTGYALVDLTTLGFYPSTDRVSSGGDSVVIQPDGQIVVAGTATTSFGANGDYATIGFETVRFNADGSLDSGFGTNGVALTQVLYLDYSPVSVGLETINNQTMIVDATRAQISATDGTQEYALVRYTPGGSLDSGTTTATATAAALSTSSSTSTSGTTTALAGSAPSGRITGTSMGDTSPGFAGSMPASAPTVPVLGLVPQVLDSPDLFDTLLPGRKRR